MKTEKSLHQISHQGPIMKWPLSWSIHLNMKHINNILTYNSFVELPFFFWLPYGYAFDHFWISFHLFYHQSYLQALSWMGQAWCIWCIPSFSDDQPRQWKHLNKKKMFIVKTNLLIICFIIFLAKKCNGCI